MARSIKSLPEANIQPERKADHFINVYLGNVQVGFMIIDEHPELVERCQSDEEFATRLLSKTTGTYRQRGVTTKTLDLSEI